MDTQTVNLIIALMSLIISFVGTILIPLYIHYQTHKEPLPPKLAQRKHIQKGRHHKR
jgi:hypothetical protein